MSSTNWLAELYINSLNMINATVKFDAAGTYTGSMTGQMKMVSGNSMQMKLP